MSMIKKNNWAIPIEFILICHAPGSCVVFGIIKGKIKSHCFHTDQEGEMWTRGFYVETTPDHFPVQS